MHLEMSMKSTFWSESKTQLILLICVAYSLEANFRMCIGMKQPN